MPEAMTLMLVARRASGIDCTEEESAEIKAYFDSDRLDRPLVSIYAADLAAAYPAEADEWFADVQAGRRG